MPGAMRVFSITDIRIVQWPGDETTLVVVEGQVSTSGWCHAHLKAMTDKLPPDGLLDLEFLAEPPAGASLPAFYPVNAQFEWANADGALRGVKVHARTGSNTAVVIQAKTDPNEPPFLAAPTPSHTVAEHRQGWPGRQSLGELFEEPWPAPTYPRALIAKDRPMPLQAQDSMNRVDRRHASPFPPRDQGL
jgi:hypothetical protein